MNNHHKLRAVLDRHKIDALLVSSSISNYYLLGYTTISPEDRDHWTLVTKKATYSYTHDLNFPLLEEHAVKNDFTPLLMNFENPMSKQIAGIVEKEDIQTIGIEPEDLRVGEYELFKKQIKKLAPKLKWKATKRLIFSLRAVKTDHEVKFLREASHLADQALTDVVKTIRSGQSELEIAQRLISWFRQKGCEPSFDPIVAIDKNAAVAHYDSTINSGTVAPGCLILIDYGVKYKHYCSDTTRVFFYGAPSDERGNTYNALLNAQEQAIQQLTKLKKAKDIDEYCRDVLKKEGMPHNYPHVTGHGVGLQVHELPAIHFRSKDTIEPGQVVTIEPGIYIPGKYGMRIEDTIHVGENNIEVLSQFPKTLQII